MTRPENLTKLSLLAGVLILASIIGSVALGLNTYYQLGKIEDSWRQFIKTTDLKSYHLSRIQAHLGYGGFIHNFKNYVLRKQEHQLLQARTNLKQLEIAMQAYEALSLSKEEDNALASIKDVIRQYKAMIPIALESAELKRPPAETDGLVIVNDEPAFYAVRELENIILNARKIGSHKIQNSVNKGLNVAHFGLMILPIFTLLSLGLIYLLHRLSSEAKANSVKLDAMISHAAEGFVTFNNKGIIDSSNEAASEMFGFKENQLTGNNICDLINNIGIKKDHMIDWERDFLRACIGRENRIYSAQQVTGKGFPVEVAISEQTLNYERNFTAILRNVSERENARQLLQDKSNLTQLLHTIASISNEALEPAPAMKTAIAEICCFKGWPIGHVYFPDPDNPNLLLPSDIWYLSQPSLFANFKQSTSKTLLRIGEGLPGRVLKNRHSCWIEDLKDDDNFIRPYRFDNYCLKAAFAVPVIIENNVIAVMEFFSEFAEEPDDNLMQIFDDIGKQLGMIFNRKNLLDRISFLASHDDLTGLPSRAVGTDRISQAIRSARRENSKVAVIFADLDNFKQINDQYGHGCGDIILKTVANRLRDCTRDADTISRFGGDEFIITLTNVQDSCSAITVCKKLIESISQPIIHQGEQHQVGISLGIALYPDHGTNDAEIISNADQAMYAAKAQGKNCYLVAPAIEHQAESAEEDLGAA